MGKHGTGKIQKVCLYCKKDFLCRHDRPGKFCGKSCSIKSRPKKNFKIKINCEYCKKDFFVRQYRKKNARFCSRKCLSIIRGYEMRKENHPKWKGGITKRSHSSRKKIKEIKQEKGKCEKCNSTDNLEGHHIYGFEKDENSLQILCSECHAKEHPKIANFIKGKYGRKMDTRNAHEKGCVEKTIRH